MVLRFPATLNPRTNEKQKHKQKQMIGIDRCVLKDESGLDVYVRFSEVQAKVLLSSFGAPILSESMRVERAAKTVDFV